MENKDEKDIAQNMCSAIIVGASLSGLMTGLALAQAGVKVIILERTGSKPRSGAALQVNSGEQDKTKTAIFLRKLASNGIRSVEAWSSVQLRLQNAACAHHNIEIHYNIKVTTIEQDENSVQVNTAQEKIFSADLLVGADGHKSIVRKIVCEEKADATYAGYMIWIGILEEKDIPKPHWPSPSATVSMPDGIGDFLLGSVVAGSDGSRAVGKRRLAWAWYDNTKNNLLRDLGCINDKMVVQHSLTSANIPDEILTDLANKAGERWQEPWLSATLHSIRNRELTGIPIAEYIPEKLVNDRLVLVGDAAHVLTPITAMGFNTALQDAATLADCIEIGLKENDVKRSLLKYESLRLNPVKMLVQSGQSFSRSFGR